MYMICITESDYISEMTAVFTAANAIMRLYKMLDWLHPSQVCYCDTDSAIVFAMKKIPNTNLLRNTNLITLIYGVV